MSKYIGLSAHEVRFVLFLSNRPVINQFHSLPHMINLTVFSLH